MKRWNASSESSIHLPHYANTRGCLPLRRPWYRPSLTTQIMIGLVVGALIGWLRPDWGNKVYFLRDIFINLIKSIIAPLVFSTIVVGIAGAGALKKVGRIGIKALIFFEVVTTAALFIGLAVVNLTKPGIGVTLAAGNSDIAKTIGQTHAQRFVETIVHIFPSSVIDAMVRGDVLQIVAFSVLFALAVSAVGEKGQPIVRAMEQSGANHVQVHKLRDDVRADRRWRGDGAHHRHARTGRAGQSRQADRFALSRAGHFHRRHFWNRDLIARIPLRQFFRAVREPATLAFATTSSESALPKAMQAMERFGVPPSIVGFVMPTGYSFNLDGSTIVSRDGLCVCRASRRTSRQQHMGFGQQITMMLTLMITSKGVAGVPRASLVILLATLNGFLPAGWEPSASLLFLASMN